MALIRKTIEDKPELTLWHVSDFLECGRSDNVKVVFSRLCEAGFLRRAFDGIYYRPKTIENLGIEVPPSPNDLAKKIAQLHRWSIVQRGETALNALGLSTQVPYVYEYSSDGPYRSYDALGTTIRFYHVSQRYIKEMSPLTALYVEAFKAMGKDKATDDNIERLASLLSEKQIERILDEAKNAPAWVYESAIRKKEEKNDSLHERKPE